MARNAVTLILPLSICVAPQCVSDTKVRESKGVGETSALEQTPRGRCGRPVLTHDLVNVLKATDLHTSLQNGEFYVV